MKSFTLIAFVLSTCKPGISLHPPSPLTISVYVLTAGAGTQFITGVCQSDADCASGCCGFTSGKCEGAIVSQERQGCGFGNAKPNNNAAKALGSKESAAAPGAAAPTGNTKAAVAQTNTCGQGTVAQKFRA